jgi:hypothetical protein
MTMARALTAVGAALLLALLVLGLAVYLTRDEDGVAVDNLLAEDITRTFATAEERGEPVVHLADVADFRWDELVLAERGVTREALSRELGFEWDGELGFQTADLLIFLDGGRLARFADYRGEGRFEGVERPFDRFERSAARFRVEGLVIRAERPG